ALSDVCLHGSAHVAADQVMDQEHRVVAHCVSVALGLDARSDWAPETTRIDWHRCVRIAQRHGVAPMVARVLSSRGADVVPSTAVAELRAWQRAHVGRSLALTTALLETLDALDA